GLPVILPGNHVPHVVEVAGDRRQLRQPAFVPQARKHVERDARGQVGVAETVLGVSQPLHHRVRPRDERRDGRLLLDLLQRDEPALTGGGEGSLSGALPDGLGHDFSSASSPRPRRRAPRPNQGPVRQSCLGGGASSGSSSEAGWSSSVSATASYSSPNTGL